LQSRKPVGLDVHVDRPTCPIQRFAVLVIGNQFDLNSAKIVKISNRKPNCIIV